jgi:GT2 family glycosyltransferase/SAM-dependent methyltransferase
MSNKSKIAPESPWTGERFVPSVVGDIALEHLHRYAIARELARGKRVLDIACGEGYGTNILATSATYVTGVDISSTVVAHAQRKYTGQNLSFKVGSCSKIPLAKASVDFVVSFETLEHHNEHQEMLTEIKRVLTPGGVLIISSPDKYEYSDVPNFKNEYHVKELYLNEFNDLLRNHFRNVEIIGQRIEYGSYIAPLQSTHNAAFATYSGDSINIQKVNGLKKPIYFIAITSDYELPQLTAGIFEGNSFIWHKDEQIKKLKGDLKNYNTSIKKYIADLQHTQETLSYTQAAITERDEQLAQAKSAITERDEQLAQAKSAITERDEQLARDTSEKNIQAQHLSSLERDIAEIRKSTSWRVTAPLRAIKQIIREKSQLPTAFMRLLGKTVRYGYWHLPLGYEQKIKLKYVLYRGMWVLRHKLADSYNSATQNASAVRRHAARKMHTSHSETNRIDADEYSSAEPHPWDDYETITRSIEERRHLAFASIVPKICSLVTVEEQNLREHAGNLRFVFVNDPLVSIVIPVYNNPRYTIECLSSVCSYTDGTSFEIIIVDDGSSEETGEILSRIENIVYLKNTKNHGFLRTCNRGAQAARGMYLMFLNNDVQVTDGWLTEMVKTFNEHPNIGAVGPKMLYPDGRLQEAGARVNRDISAQLIGVGDDPSLPRYNNIRDVDYCSGACLLVETKIFHELRGFDDDLAPAYCEDSDLCFRLHNRGLRVVYNPNAVIIHHLSVTSDSINETYKQTCVVRNQQKLAEKWQDYIDQLNDVKLIAFYLPQFHPIPENDRWWGKGFTEWSNVAKARPNYAGQYQPRLPADLGFYDLRVEEVMEQQAELAKRYGIYGFCYFYYWFGGKRLLEMPLERLFKTGKPDIPFCLSWANENWTRRWDGMEHDVLIGQDHSDDDDIAVIKDLMRFFQLSNYIRINGKPLLLVYRIGLFPDIKRTVGIWREVCREEGIGEIYLAMVESFEYAVVLGTPSEYGFDASVEYPPHGMAALTKLPGPLLNHDYIGSVNDYREVVMKYLERPIPGYKRFRGVMPSWDNTARRQNRSGIFAYASPGAYQAWLEGVIKQTREQNFGDERIVFVNAWNEWAEGAHLEPDRRFGHSYLEATRNAKENWLLK